MGESIRFVEGLLSFAEGFDQIEESELHVTRVESRSRNDERAFVLEVETSWHGRVSDLRRGDRLKWRASLVHQRHEWLLAALAAVECESVVSRPLFVDVSGDLPAPAHRAHPRSAEFSNTYFNGVSIADWDGDEDLDLWVARPFQAPLWLENDGLGSFSSLQPPTLEARSADLEWSERGAAYFVDLDNDGGLEMLELGRHLGIETVIGVTSHPDSALRELSDIVLDMGEVEEPCPIGMTPSASIAVMLAISDALALVLLEMKGFSKDDFGRRHHGGYLGRVARLDNE